ncbi:MAG: hypothetical protein BGO28_01750 [Alphaproteobacteria bacterium 43-37]|nr:MAG: hypothetical protein BGO28_01750 [Alphaproteobacteria bacterium 43-37]
MCGKAKRGVRDDKGMCLGSLPSSCSFSCRFRFFPCPPRALFFVTLAKAGAHKNAWVPGLAPGKTKGGLREGVREDKEWAREDKGGVRGRQKGGSGGTKSGRGKTKEVCGEDKREGPGGQRGAPG